MNVKTLAQLCQILKSRFELDVTNSAWNLVSIVMNLIDQLYTPNVMVTVEYCGDSHQCQCTHLTHGVIIHDDNQKVKGNSPYGWTFNNIFWGIIDDTAVIADIYHYTITNIRSATISEIHYGMLFLPDSLRETVWHQYLAGSSLKEDNSPIIIHFNVDGFYRPIITSNASLRKFDGAFIPIRISDKMFENIAVIIRCGWLEHDTCMNSEELSQLVEIMSYLKLTIY